MSRSGTSRSLLRGLGNESGGSLVEMALVSALVYLPMLFAIFEFSFAIYGYTFVSNAARNATRYASVRGVDSCTIALPQNFPNCNLGPSGGSNPTTASGSAALQTYVQSLAFPGINTNNITVTANWWSATTTNPGTGAYSTTNWNTQCTTTDSLGNACNTPGDAVQVNVQYTLPLAIPFWRGSRNITVSSTSEMIINE